MSRIRRMLVSLSLGAVVLGGGLAVASPASAAPGDWTVSATSVDFGSVAVGGDSAKLSVVISNTSTGSLALPITTGTLTPGGPFEFTFSNCTAGDIYAPGEQCAYTFTFFPVDLGPAVDTLPFTLDGVPMTLTLSGVGVSAFTVTPTTVDFGQVVVGQSGSEALVTVTNVSVYPQTPTFALGAPTSADFTYQSGCPAAGTIAPGGSCDLLIVFTPSALGPVTGTVTVGVSSESFTVTLLGTGVTVVSPPAAPSAAPATPSAGSALADSGPPDALPPLALALGLIVIGIGARLASRRARVATDR